MCNIVFVSVTAASALPCGMQRDMLTLIWQSQYDSGPGEPHNESAAGAATTGSKRRTMDREKRKIIVLKALHSMVSSFIGLCPGTMASNFLDSVFVYNRRCFPAKTRME